MAGSAAMEIRPGRRGDEGALSAVARAAFLETFAGILPGTDIELHCRGELSPGRFQDYLSDPDSRIWLAEAMPGAAPVGYLLLTQPNLPLEKILPADREIKKIYILHRFQGMGLGRRLLAAVHAAGRSAGWQRLLLGVYRGNEGALGFYRRQGFREVGVRRFRVGNNSYDDLILGTDVEL